MPEPFICKSCNQPSKQRFFLNVPWCIPCIEAENKRMKDHEWTGIPGQFRSEPRWLKDSP